MRHLIDIVTEAARPKPSREDLQQRRIAEIIRLYGDPDVATAPAGKWYRITKELLASDAVNTYMDGELVQFNMMSTIYHLPGHMVVIPGGKTWNEISVYVHTGVHTGYRYSPIYASHFLLPDNFFPNLNSLVRRIDGIIGGIDSLYAFPQAMKNQDGDFHMFAEVLNAEGNASPLPSGTAHEVSSDFVARAVGALKEKGISATFAKKNPSRYFIVFMEGDTWLHQPLLVAVKDGKQIGVSGKLRKDSINLLTKELAAQVGIDAESQKIKPNSKFHKMLEFIFHSPGMGRSNWLAYVGLDPSYRPSVENALDGLAARMGLITLRDQGKKETTYQLRLTELGKTALTQLNTGKAISVDDYKQT